VLVWSVLAWTCFWLFHFLTLQALPVSLSLSARLSLSLGALALAPPSAPTQPGVYHASLVAPLRVMGFEGATLTAYAISLHALQMLWMVSLGLWGVSRSGLSLRSLWAWPAA
jgi:hypothetical protein